MALTKNDINLLKESFRDTFATKEDLSGFATKNDLNGMKNDLLQAMEDKSRITTDLLRSEIKASGSRQTTALQKTKKEIINEVTEFIGNHLIPQLDSHEQRITKLETAHV